MISNGIAEVAICDGKWDQLLVIPFSDVKLNPFYDYIAAYEINQRCRFIHGSGGVSGGGTMKCQPGLLAGSAMCDGKQDLAL